MADRWIVTTKTFAQHATLEMAEQEAVRLGRVAPAKTYRVIRIKTTLRRSNAEAVIADLLAAIGPLIGEANAQIANLERVARAAADGRIAVMVATEIARLQGLADAGAAAVARTHEPNGSVVRRAPLDTSPARCLDDRTPASTPAVSPETNPSHVQHLDGVTDASRTA